MIAHGVCQDAPATSEVDSETQRGFRYQAFAIGPAQACRKLTAFIVISGNLRGVDTAQVLLRAMNKILAVLKSQRGPFIYCVYKDSSIKRVG